MRNAKKEFVKDVGDRKVLCADIEYMPDYFTVEKSVRLRLNYTDQEYTNFLTALDFEYNSGWGGQELYGIVWFADNSWLERYEYDGSEEWVHATRPEIPDFLMGT